ncbi:MAG: hypothetical protein WBD27_06430 [Pyrinomonadaceae bacterium]
MKNTTVEMKNDGKDYTRFENLLREVISVPKEELKRREEVEKQKKEVKKKETASQ